MKGSLALILLITSFASAQSIERSAITFMHHNSSGTVDVHGSMGQVIIGSQPSLGMSQGFEQPPQILKVEYEKLALPCSEGGALQLVAEISSICTGNAAFYINDQEVDLTQLDLLPGSYDLRVEGENYCPYESSFVVENDEGSDRCDLVFYNVIFPNGMSGNQSWVIENIDSERFANNEVTIYNRWGAEVWSGVNYDNSEVVFEGRSNDDQLLSDATYYYSVRIGEDEFKGYLELIR